MVIDLRNCTRVFKNTKYALVCALDELNYDLVYANHEGDVPYQDGVRVTGVDIYHIQHGEGVTAVFGHSEVGSLQRRIDCYLVGKELDIAHVAGVLESRLQPYPNP